MGAIWLFIGVVISFSFLAAGDDDVLPITRTPLELDAWTLADIFFISKLKASADSEVLGNEPVQKYIQDFEDNVKNLKDYSGSLSKRTRAIADNPVATFRMIRRLAFDLEELRDLYEDDYDELFEHFPRGRWLQKVDAEDAVSGILRLSHVYDLDALSIAEGLIGGVPTGAALSWRHCYEIGRVASRLNFHALSVEWLELALSKAGEGTPEGDMVEVALETTIKAHDKAFGELGLHAPYSFETRLGLIRESENFTSLRRTNRKALEEKYSGNDNDIYNDVNYWALCTKGSLQTDEERSKLKCWYEPRRHLYFLIGPLKMEMLSLNPDVLQIYEVIGDKKIQEIKEAGSQNMKVSSVVDGVNEEGKIKSITSPVRSSVNGWIFELLFPNLYVVPWTIEKITGMRVLEEPASDMLQVAAYTFGGHYGVHIDAFVTPTDELGIRKGDRIATFMYYLETPTLGGATAFPQGKVAAQPIKGSAVFWYDVHRDGSADYRTFHGACPVILGRKWVANKWIRYFEQFNTRKCGLAPDERYQIRPFTY